MSSISISISAYQIFLCRYFFSTCLSLWNRRLLGRGHGVFGLGPFPSVPSGNFKSLTLYLLILLNLCNQYNLVYTSETKSPTSRLLKEYLKALDVLKVYYYSKFTTTQSLLLLLLISPSNNHVPMCSPAVDEQPAVCGTNRDGQVGARARLGQAAGARGQVLGPVHAAR